MFRLLVFTLFIYRIYAKSCSGHDGCKDQVFTDHSLTCNGGERCCKNVAMTCTSGMACNVKIKGGGHDQFQNSEIFAQEATSLDVSCAASGLRECQNTKIFCPATTGSTCKCTGCVSSTKMYCPHGVTCTSGGATLVNMNKYFCKGTGSNVYCNDITYSISTTCPDNPPDVCISTVMYGGHYSVTCAKGTSYERPRCPEYYQDRYDNIKYHQINVTVTEHEDAALPLEELCKTSIPPKDKLMKSANRAFQIKSWNVGCEKRKSKLNKCKSACNSPQGCCGLTCASNSCSGGGCCSASKNICKAACDFMFSPQVYNVIPYINVTNRTRWINTTRYNNRTRWINTTRYINRTKWFNITIDKYIYKNKTRWTNRTIDIFVDKIRWINRTRIVPEVKTFWVNKTRTITKTRWVNLYKTKYVYENKIRWTNKTREKKVYVDKIKWKEEPKFYMDLTFGEFFFFAISVILLVVIICLLSYIHKENMYLNFLDFINSITCGYFEVEEESRVMSV